MNEQARTAANAGRALLRVTPVDGIGVLMLPMPLTDRRECVPRGLVLQDWSYGRDVPATSRSAHEREVDRSFASLLWLESVRQMIGEGGGFRCPARDHNGVRQAHPIRSGAATRGLRAAGGTNFCSEHGSCKASAYHLSLLIWTRALPRFDWRVPL